MRTRALWAVVVGISACAVHEKPAKPAQRIVPASQYLAEDGTVLGGVGPQGKFICDMETPLGTHVSRRVCRYVDDDEESMSHRSQTQEALRTHPVCATGGDSGNCKNNMRP
jgi:hypothetical protein